MGRKSKRPKFEHGEEQVEGETTESIEGHGLRTSEMSMQHLPEWLASPIEFDADLDRIVALDRFHGLSTDIAQVLDKDGIDAFYPGKLGG